MLQLRVMLDQLGPLAVEVLDIGHVVGLEHAAVHHHHLVARGGQLLDGGAAYEPRPAQNNDSQKSMTLTPWSWPPFPARSPAPRCSSGSSPRSGRSGPIRAPARA